MAPSTGGAVANTGMALGEGALGKIKQVTSPAGHFGLKGVACDALTRPISDT